MMKNKDFLNILLLLLLIELRFVNITSDKITHQPLDISDTKLAKISKLSEPNHFLETLDKILIRRIPGTEGHKKVRKFIVDSMEKLNWQVDSDSFVDKTPNGKIRFENIIATQNPLAKRYLILACHYDSKILPNNVEFLGAIDSAVPCAMLINLAKVLNKYLTLQNQQDNGNDIGLMFVFFDGEEAFEQWGPKDSIYGARHLASKWDSNGFLKQIDMLVLLDLLGAPDPKFYSFFKETEDWYARLLNAEDRLAAQGSLEKYTSSGITQRTQERYFQPNSANSYVDDDHIPFLRRGVPIMHLIPIPFPEVWHTPEDNKENIDFASIENLSKILRIFVVEYLRIPMDDS